MVAVRGSLNKALWSRIHWTSVIIRCLWTAQDAVQRNPSWESKNFTLTSPWHTKISPRLPTILNIMSNLDHLSKNSVQTVLKILWVTKSQCHITASSRLHNRLLTSKLIFFLDSRKPTDLNFEKSTFKFLNILGPEKKITASSSQVEVRFSQRKEKLMKWRLFHLIFSKDRIFTRTLLSVTIGPVTVN